MRTSEWIVALLSLLLVAHVVGLPKVCAGAEKRYSLMPHLTITTGNGEPAHDIPKIGLKGRYLLSRLLYLTLSLDYTEYDFERPYKLLGINATKEMDAHVSGMYLDIGTEREFYLNRMLQPYIGVGVGLTFIDADDISGRALNGDRFRIETETDTEYIPYFNSGVRWVVWNNLSLDVGTRFQYHLADWVVTDRVSRLSNNIDDYFQYGGYIGISVGF